MIVRPVDRLVIRTLRRWSALYPGEASALGGLGDARIGRVLSMLPCNPAAPWSLANLDELVGMMRSTSTERFTALVGRHRCDITRAGG
jgi:transcriptional regulator GlxA family with amidase domain